MPDQPRLHTNSQTVTLSFEGTLIQSCMRVADPDDLVLDYTRTMMGALLFNPKPRRVLMIGLGGGSMLKYLHRHVPEADLTVVEISQSVIDLRDVMFFASVMGFALFTTGVIIRGPKPGMITTSKPASRCSRVITREWMP